MDIEYIIRVYIKGGHTLLMINHQANHQGNCWHKSDKLTKERIRIREDRIRWNGMEQNVQNTPDRPRCIWNLFDRGNSTASLKGMDYLKDAIWSIG